jgi:hypothetical protein
MCISLIVLFHVLQHVTAAHVAQESVTATRGSASVMTMLLGRSVITARQSTMASTPVRFVRIMCMCNSCLCSILIVIFLSYKSQCS